jgi:hypothetical protein
MADADRDWIERHAVAFALGELDPTQEARFRDAASGDPEFEDLLAASESADAGHVPAALIARWGVAGRDLSGAERSLVERHLRTCPTCREELELVGRAAPTSIEDLASSRHWTPWIGGAVLGAAAMAAFLLFLSPQQPSLQGETIAVVSPRAVRGEETMLLELDADARAFLLALALPVDVEPGARVMLALLDPHGDSLLQTALAPPPWRPPSTQVLVVAKPRFEEGEYRVRLRISGEDQARELGRFRIAHAR